MTLTPQQRHILSLMLKLDRETTPNELKSLYSEKHHELGVGIYKQLDRMIEDGFIKRVSDRHYTVTQKTINILEDKQSTKAFNINFTKEQIQSFIEFSKQENHLEKLTELLNPAILGLHTERLAVLATMVSQKDEYGDRNRISILLSGSTGVGKTKIIEYAYNHLWGFWCDWDTSTASLRGVVKGSLYKEGLLQKANNGTLFIDELDKMPQEEQNALSQAIETGIVSVHKDMVHQETPARIRAIATSNKTSTILSNLLSRFDLILDLKPLTDEEKERLLRKKINDWNREKGHYDATFFKDYMNYANQFDVKLPDDRDTISNYISSELKSGSLQGRDVRGLDSAIRFSIAIAKLSLHQNMKLEDLKKAIELIKEHKG